MTKLRSILWRSNKLASGGSACFEAEEKRSTKSDGMMIRSARCMLLHQYCTIYADSWASPPCKGSSQTRFLSSPSQTRYLHLILADLRALKTLA